MIEKEISELRRHLRPDRHSITKIYGCYVSAQKEIISQFCQSVALMTEEEHEKYLTLLKKVLSGALSRNLTDISFRTAQVADSDEHRLLSTLRTSALADDEARQKLYDTIISSLALEDNYLILLAADRYDVPYRTRDDRQLDDGSEEVFSYFLCAICPVKQAKPALCYTPEEKDFHNLAGRWSVSAPETGFLFPAFDGRRANIYGALYYNRDIKVNHEELASALFNTELPMPAAEQQQTFAAVLGQALEEECSLPVVQQVHEQITELIDLHKQSKDPEPLTISGAQVRQILSDCGVSEARAASFSVQCDAEFGTDAELAPRNLIDQRHFALRTPDVTIQVSPERSDLIETRVIGGSKYILICADEGVEVNGVPIQIPDQN